MDTMNVNLTDDIRLFSEEYPSASADSGYSGIGASSQSEQHSNNCEKNKAKTFSANYTRPSSYQFIQEEAEEKKNRESYVKLGSSTRSSKVKRVTTVLYPEATPRHTLIEENPDLDDSVKYDLVRKKCGHCGSKLKGGDSNREFVQVRRVDPEEDQSDGSHSDTEPLVNKIERESTKFKLLFVYRIRLALFLLFLACLIVTAVVIIPYWADKPDCDLDETRCPPGLVPPYVDAENFCCSTNETCCLAGKGIGSCCLQESTCCGGACCSESEQCCGSVCIPKEYECCSVSGSYCGEHLQCCRAKSIVHCCPDFLVCSSNPNSCETPN